MKTKILYWTITLLFAVFMIFSAVPDLLMVEDAITFMIHLGYPRYFLPFIGLAKLLGCIAILIPSFVQLKEWAYAGLCYDLIGAGYSVIATEGFIPAHLFILFPLALLFYSRYLNKKLKAQTV